MHSAGFQCHLLMNCLYAFLKVLIKSTLSICMPFPDISVLMSPALRYNIFFWSDFIYPGLRHPVKASIKYEHTYGEVGSCDYFYNNTDIFNTVLNRDRIIQILLPYSSRILTVLCLFRSTGRSAHFVYQV